MVDARLKIDNKTARALWLQSHGLADNPTGTLDLLGTIRQLGFVQLDTIQVVARAHHHILWSRNQNYREPMLDKLMRTRDIFEHFTHDASVLPMEFLPMWQRQFRRMKEKIDKGNWYKNMLNEDGRREICARIQREGALSTHAFDTKVKGEKKMWSRPPHKLALDYMWYAGELATCHRSGFTKYYDLAARVFPEKYREISMSDEAQLAWLCEEALARLNFGTSGEIQKFWDAASAQEVKGWCEAAGENLINVEVEAADGQWNAALALPDIAEKLGKVKKPTSRLRILNPFDPTIRDRDRLKRLFGFDYRIEMFVPANKRIWGYYVYPILEGDRFVGRIEVKANRDKGTLTIINFWPEPGVKWAAARTKKLQAELERLARFVSVSETIWQTDMPYI